MSHCFLLQVQTVRMLRKLFINSVFPSLRNNFIITVLSKSKEEVVGVNQLSKWQPRIQQDYNTEIFPKISRLHHSYKLFDLTSTDAFKIYRDLIIVSSNNINCSYTKLSKELTGRCQTFLADYSYIRNMVPWPVSRFSMLSSVHLFEITLDVRNVSYLPLKLPILMLITLLIRYTTTERKRWY